MNFSLSRTACALVLSIGTQILVGCSATRQAHSPMEGTTRTEDVSHVIYNYPWLKKNVYLRDFQVDRGEGNILRVAAQLHSLDEHTSRTVYIKTDFYSGEFAAGGRLVDSTAWEPFVLEPRRRMTYQANSLVPADDFRVYVNYPQDIGKP
ncbi:MAG: hypothetical protein J5J06_09380 [Phycisphaerae bacterium]|nr:hypothetical protein [Phycisphaerae bacterium]